ncbi:SpoIIE family protein phosphatase [Streptomyces dioscori]|uniref:SpoIIE family protein phosphatase n=1 Tax=Streptomyces dioscori TaxID=2109333 RepID=UPI00131EC120|nr:SpoIIE family protein phosphatase [Streptomyces dioscori]
MNAERPPRWLLPQTAQAALPVEVAGFAAGLTGNACECGFLRGIVEDTLAPIAILDEQLRYLYVNPAFVRVSGVPATAFLGRTLGDVLPDVQGPTDILVKVMKDGKPREAIVTGTTRVPSSVGRRLWRAVFHRLEAQGRVVGVCGIGVEASNLRRYLDDLENAHQRLAMLDTAATRVGTTLDVKVTCAELADFLAPSMADIAAVGIVEEESDGTSSPAPGILRLRKMALAAPEELKWRLRLLGGPEGYLDLPRDSVARRCMDSGRAWRGNLASDEVFQKATIDPKRARMFRAAGIHSLLFVPLPTAGRSVGVVILGRGDGSTPFSDDDILTAQGLAERAATSIDSARRYTYEHTMALELQRALLSEPGSPHPDVEVATRYLPSGRGALVGGDWYDSIALPGGRTLLVMGDVMGHGFRASVVMSQYRSLLRTVAASGMPVEKILGETDRRVAHIGLDRAATCLLALMDPQAGTCTVASAGHLPPVVIRPGGDSRMLWAPAGPPIGTELGDYESITVRMEPGTVLLLYTDGLVEQRGTDIDVSLRALAEQRLSAHGTLDDLLDTLLDGLANGVPEDDVALLAARQRPP